MSIRGPKPAESVSLLLWDGSRVFLVRRDGSRGLFPHAWTLPGNPMRPGETQLAAAGRVCREALGIAPERITRLRPLHEPSPFRQDRGPDTLMRVVEWTGEPAARLANWDSGGWFSLTEMRELRMLREGRDVVAAECEQLEQAQPAR